MGLAQCGLTLGRGWWSPWDWPPDKWGVYWPGHWFQPCRLEGGGFSMLPWHLEWSACSSLWMILISCALELTFWIGTGHYGLAIHDYSKLIALITRLNCCPPQAKPASVLCEDQVRSTIVFLWDGDCFKLYLVQFVFLFYFEVILDLKKNWQK